jgi:16S rRNA processing protein RimM
LRIKLDIVDNEDKANQLLKSKVYLPMKDLPPLEGNKFYFHEVIDFNVIDQAIGDLGNIFEINDQTSQPILIVKKNDKKIMIPLVDEFIVELNKKEKKIIFNLPEGLTEL